MRDQPNQAAPYPTPESLPPAIRADLPPQAHRLYFDAFTSAWQRYADYADREPFCHRVARSAVRSHQRSLVSRFSEARRRPVA
ncbi:MAG: ChaB family protein [Enhydrobacter sp.]|nr:ChaB family protein [Enhydrobacter sp.]